MMTNATMEKLREMKLVGMAKGFEEQLAMTNVSELSFEERFGLLVDREDLTRTNRRSTTRLKAAKLKEQATIEDIDWRGRRGLDKGVVLSLASCDWVRKHQGIIISGKTGAGKTWLACALAHRACVEGFSSLFYRMPRLFGELAAARADGTYPKLLAKLAKASVLVLDDFGAALSEQDRRDLLEIVEDRYSVGSLIITTQVPISSWPEVIGDPTVADAILDRVVHNSHKLDFDGANPSQRKLRGAVAPTTQEG